MSKKSFCIVSLERLSSERIEMASQQPRLQEEQSQQPPQQTMTEQKSSDQQQQLLQQQPSEQQQTTQDVHSTEQQQPFTYQDIFGDLSDDDIDDRPDNEQIVSNTIRDDSCEDTTPHNDLMESNVSHNAADAMQLNNSDNLVSPEMRESEICLSPMSSPIESADDIASQNTNKCCSPGTSETLYLSPISSPNMEAPFLSDESSPIKHTDNIEPLNYTNGHKPRGIHVDEYLTPITSPIVHTVESVDTDKCEFGIIRGNATISSTNDKTKSSIGETCDGQKDFEFGCLTPLSSIDDDIIYGSDNESFITITSE